ICQLVGRYLHPARSKAVHGIRLVIGARHQACEGELHSLGSIALQNKAIEGVEREYALIENSGGRNLRKHAAFRRFRIDILELVEVSWILEITKSRDAVTLGSFSCLGNRHENRGKRRGTNGETIAPSHEGNIDHDCTECGGRMVRRRKLLIICASSN